MENSTHTDGAVVWSIVVDDVLLDLDATTTEKKIVPRLPSFGKLGQTVQGLIDRGAVARALTRSPHTLRIELNIVDVPER
jgi:hypothetical protein